MNSKTVKTPADVVRCSRPGMRGRDLVVASAGVATLCVQLPIIKMILDDPQVLSLASWDWTTFILFSALTFVGLPLAFGVVFALLFKVHARMSQIILVGVTCYLLAIQMHFYHVHLYYMYYMDIEWRRFATMTIFLALCGLMWRFRRQAVETLKVCAAFSVGIFLFFAYYTAPFNVTRSWVASVEPTATAVSEVNSVFFLTFEKLVAPYVVDEDGQVLTDRFPNLARFASGADYYPNAYANTARTVYSLKTLYSGRVVTVEKKWRRNPNLRGILGPDRDVVMVLDTVALDYCEPTQDTCIQSMRFYGTAGLDIIAGCYKTYAYTIVPQRLYSAFSLQRDWAFDPRQAMWARDAATLKPGETVQGKVGRREFQELIKVVRQQGPAPSLYIMHNFISDRPGVKTSILTGRTEAEHRQEMEAARDNLASFDEGLGMFLDALQEVGVYDASLIVITSDTGYDPHMRYIKKGTEEFPASEEMARVFLGIKRPGQKEGRVIRAPIRHVDVLPTVLVGLGMDPGRYAFEGEPVTDPNDMTQLVQRPVEFVVVTSTEGLLYYELTNPAGPFRRIDKPMLRW